jgi:hypothetical protein
MLQDAVDAPAAVAVRRGGSPALEGGGMSMSTQDAGRSWLRRGAAAAIAAAGVLIPAGYVVATYEAYCGPFCYMVGAFVLMLLVVCPAIAGLIGAALVRGWDGAGSLLAGTFVGCVFSALLVVAVGRSVNLAEVVPLFILCSVPLLIGYGIGRGLARLG